MPNRACMLVLSRRPGAWLAGWLQKGAAQVSAVQALLSSAWGLSQDMAADGGEGGPAALATRMIEEVRRETGQPPVQQGEPSEGPSSPPKGLVCGANLYLRHEALPPPLPCLGAGRVSGGRAVCAAGARGQGGLPQAAAGLRRQAPRRSGRQAGPATHTRTHIRRQRAEADT